MCVGGTRLSEEGDDGSDDDDDLDPLALRGTYCPSAQLIIY